MRTLSALRSTINMLMSPSSRGADVLSKPPPCALSQSHPLAKPVQRCQQPTAFTVLAMEDVNPIIIYNGIDDRWTDAELLIDSYYEALQPNAQSGKKQRSSTPPPPISLVPWQKHAGTIPQKNIRNRSLQRTNRHLTRKGARLHLTKTTVQISWSSATPWSNNCNPEDWAGKRKWSAIPCVEQKSKTLLPMPHICQQSMMSLA